MANNHDGHTSGMNDRENEAGAIERGRRFQAACELMKKNAANLINTSSSSSEDEGASAIISQKTLSENSDGDERSAYEISKNLEPVDCLICIESVRRNDKTWSCVQCFGIFHLHCIQKWAKDSLYQLAIDPNQNQKEPSLKWCCPKCRNDYSPFEQPKKYVCFCGKVENPLDLWRIPHSCGKRCDKQLKPDCSHTCSVRCHPGPCPPCAKAVLVSCGCSKSKPVSNICSKKDWSCGEKCGKMLPCQRHFCEEVCHKGPCPICPSSGTKTCPCSKKKMFLHCTETVQPCGDTCNKVLSCEIHRCSQRCHYGPCDTCFQMRVMKCNCGQREKSLPCCKKYICDLKCKRHRDCGKHFCNRRCCIGQCPPCEVPCGKTLNCGTHKCSSICHQGPCSPCREIVTMTCNCGVTEITVSCVSKKSALRPRCSSDCKKIIKPFKWPC